MFARASAGFVLFAALTAQVSPAEAPHRLLVVNRGTLPISRLQMGHEVADTWSGDLLRWSDVIDVGEARNVTIAPSADCTYDLRATHRDGTNEVLHDVDLCRSTSVTFEH
ncbi:MAG: hypothetical protein JOZ38_12605 [Candidatus Eremiobacteraeota bacterium]|nr:hypothetical protein [Candidatus Eremiobacteraeota bacterium]